jgi:prevent-host-death family protein
MLQKVSVVEARNKLSDLLGQIYYGNTEVLIQKTGKPVAVLISVGDYNRYKESRDYFFEMIAKNRRANKRLKSGKIKKDIEEAIAAVRKTNV